MVHTWRWLGWKASGLHTKSLSIRSLCSANTTAELFSTNFSQQLCSWRPCSISFCTAGEMAGGPILGSNKRYNSKVTFTVWFIVILGGCGGLLLGYDNGKAISSLMTSYNIKSYLAGVPFLRPTLLLADTVMPATRISYTEFKPDLAFGMRRCHRRCHSYEGLPGAQS